MLIYILKLNLKQIFRTFLEIGIVRTIILFLMLTSFYGILIQKILDIENQWFIVIVLLSIIFSIHANRKDKYFLEKTTRFVKLIYIVQYLIIITPFLISYLIVFKFIFATICLISIVLISYLNINFSFKTNFKQINFNFLNSILFEWFTGLRKNWLVILILYILSFALCKYEIAILIPTILISLIISGFFCESESNLILQAFQLNSKLLIKHKIIKNIKLQQIIFLPQYILYLILFPKHWFVVFIPIIFTTILLIFAILTKYSNYAPNRNLNVNIVHITLFVLCFAQPYLFPIPIIMLIRNYKKAINNLKLYLND